MNPMPTTSRTPAALADLWQEHATTLRQRCVRWLGNLPDADDAVAQTALAAVSKYAGVARHLDSPERWLSKIAYHSCIDIIRARSRDRGRHVWPTSEAVFEERRPAHDPERQYLTAAMGETVRRAVGELSLALRTVVRLRLDHELTDAEIAAALGISPVAVRQRWHVARKTLRRRLDPAPRRHLAAAIPAERPRPSA